MVSRLVVPDSNFEVVGDERCQVSASALVVLVAEIIDVEGCAVPGQRPAILVTDVLLDDHNGEPVPAIRVFDSRQDSRRIEPYLRCDDHMGCISLLPLSEYGRRGQPAGVSSRDLDHGYRRGGAHRFSIPSCPLCRRGYEASRAAVAGRVVRSNEIIVDSLGNEEHLEIEACVFRRRANGQGSRCGVVSANDEPVSNLTPFDEINNSRQFAVGELLACRPKSGSRGNGNGPPRGSRDRRKVEHSITEDTFDSALSAEYSGESSRLCSLVAYSEQAAVDDRRRAARLHDQKVLCRTHRSLPKRRFPPR